MSPALRDTDRHGSASADKAALRAELRAARAAMAPGDRRKQSEALADAVTEHLGGGPAPGRMPGGARPVVTAYLGIDPEPDTTLILEALYRRGVDVVLPICEPAYRMSWTSWSPGVALQRSVRAPVAEPVGTRRAFDQLADVLLILVPALGVDLSGQRVGQGGGYYDRFLAHHPLAAANAVPRLGVVYRSEVLPAGAVPAEPHDQPLTGVLTADGLHRFEGGAEPV
ncbi:5-formyltetrahydrofolate cyclo-ligase [Arthrobacter agilis]|uniref:5-formyltetrahydrofolate cyclo-ligase n=1 Tax=Arthrobacter agilis TaxID=37921 RepID=UPI00236524EB|nr:5-formyltetrahydrofolate cyclo-ligase [Arthrobacter agilis]WDF32531.1 5-formyltetrahydrofolate cyclo-ligase [Arthrobacter agilis]